MARTAEAMPKRVGKRRRLLFFQLFFVLGFLILLGVVWFTNTPTSSSQGIPKRVGELHLTGSVTGPKALEQIAKLHGKDIVLVDGYLASYSHEEEGISVWVGVASSSNQATQLLELMTTKIGEGRSPFSNPQEMTVDGQRVFSVAGGGQSHFYYQAGEKVVWLTVERGEPLSLLKQALRVF